MTKCSIILYLFYLENTQEDKIEKIVSACNHIVQCIQQIWMTIERDLMTGAKLQAIDLMQCAKVILFDLITKRQNKYLKFYYLLFTISWLISLEIAKYKTTITHIYV